MLCGVQDKSKISKPSERQSSPGNFIQNFFKVFTWRGDYTIVWLSACEKDIFHW